MKIRVLALTLSMLLATAAGAASSAALQSPDKVKEALRILAYVQADMASKLPNKAYDRLPHENQEFQEAAPALLDALASEPAGLKTKAASLLKTAQAAAQHVAEVSKTHDEATITRAVAAVDAALKPLNALFPAELRPLPGQLGGRPMPRGPGAPAGADAAKGGPPPDLR